MTNRLFIAAEIDPALKQAIHTIQQYLKKSDSDVKWVHSENIHITLKFLGDVDETRTQRIITDLKKTLSALKPFEVQVGKVGGFPDLARPRVLWIGLEDNQNLLEKLAEEVEKTLEPLGFEKEGKKFSTHLTIGRVRSNANLLKLKELLKAVLVPEDLRQSIQRISLFKSTLTSAGPIYEPLLTQTL